MLLAIEFLKLQSRQVSLALTLPPSRSSVRELRLQSRKASQAKQSVAQRYQDGFDSQFVSHPENLGL